MKKAILGGLALCLFTLTLIGWIGKIACVSAATQGKRTVTIIDEMGRYVEVPSPLKRIACLVPAVAEVICAFGDGDKIVARSNDCNFPPSLKEKLSVGSSRAVNLELLLEQKPDVVITRTVLFKKEIREKIEMAGIPVIQFWSIELNTVLPMIKKMGLILDKKGKAEELAGFIENYANLIQGRIKKLKPEEKPSVFFQSMGHMYWTVNADTAGHRRITAAGGINIAAGEPVKVPRVSAEWVLERNPDITVYSYLKARKSARAPSLEEMKKIQEEITNEPGLRETKAVKEGKVYIIDTRLITGPRSIIGILYYAKWFHPELFKDIDPEAVHKEMLQRFYGVKLEGTWVYPE